MSISSSSPRRRRRAWLAVATAAALTLGSAGLATADSIDVDGDAVKMPPNVQYGPVSNPANHACDTRGTAVTGSLDVDYDSSGGADKHYAPGEALTITATPTIPGITVDLPTSPSIPDDWGDGTTTLPLSLGTTVTTGLAAGEYTITITVTGQDSGIARTGTYNVSIDSSCTITSSNTAPTVEFTSAATTSDEGSAVSYTFAITDPDAGQTWAFASGYPICGTDGTASNASVDSTAKTGSFDCTFPDGPADRTVAVKVTDSAGADSNEDTIGATVENVDPVVSTPALDVSSVDCGTQVTLSPISFSDAGEIDNPWAVDIDWGDGEHTQYDASTQGPQSDATHTYLTGGTFTPTVTVTDKDGGSDTATSSNSVAVNQYIVDFLPPFDDSSPSKLIVNKMKNGRVVPVKATIFDECAQAPVDDPTESVTIKTSKTAGGGTGDPVETYADAGQSASDTNQFRWSTDGFWIYNLDSKGLGLVVNNNYRVDIYVDGDQATTKSWAVLQPVK